MNKDSYNSQQLLRFGLRGNGATLIKYA